MIYSMFKGTGANHSFDIGSDDNTVVFSADGRGMSGIFLLDLKAGKVSQVVDSEMHERTPTLSPDLKTVCYSSSQKPMSVGHLYTCGLKGENIRQLTSDPNGSDSDPCYTPDGSHILFARAALIRDYSMGGKMWNDWDIWSLELKTGTQTQLTNNKYYEVSAPRSSPDGKSVIFTDHIYNKTKSTDDVTSVPIDGSKPPSHITEEGDFSGPEVVKHSGDILFIAMRNSKKRNGGGLFEYEIWKMDRNGKNQTEVTQLRTYLSNIRALRSEETALCLDDPSRNNERNIMRIDLKTGKATKIAGPDLFHNPLKWKPER